jgi:putative membrane protein
MKKINLLILPVIAVALLQACSGNEADRDADSTEVLADNAPAATQLDSSTPAATDTAFANKAAVSGMAEVALGKMAAEKGASAEVKDFGNMMVKDHGAANEELKSIAQKKNITLPSGLDAEHQAKSDSLSKLSGKDFDKAYVKVMIEGHHKTLGIMNNEATGGQDVDLKAFAKKTAPVVQHHLEEIEKIQAKVK